jgi:ribonuclease HII
LVRVPATRTLENALRRLGFVYVAGTDEVGRGCLAGPVVAAAVVLHPDRHVPGVADSKAVPASERETLYEQIIHDAVAWATAEADPNEIDRINIHQASLRAMQRAILALAPLPDIVLVDAFRPVCHGAAGCPARRPPVPAIAQLDRGEGDARSSARAARARPALRLRRHKGYATADHLDAVARYGYPTHRRSSTADAV